MENEKLSCQKQQQQQQQGLWDFQVHQHHIKENELHFCPVLYNTLAAGPLHFSMPDPV